MKPVILLLTLTMSVAALASTCQQNGEGQWCGDTNNPSYKVSHAGNADQVHIFGNALINVVANRLGEASVFNAYRGFSYLGNDKESGYSFIDFHQPGQNGFTLGNDKNIQSFKQTFSLNGVTTETHEQNITTTHHLYVKRNPANSAQDTATVFDDITLNNTKDQTETFDHYEIWDSAYLPMSSPTDVLLPGKPFQFLGKIADILRRKFVKQNFVISEKKSNTANALSVNLTAKGGALYASQPATDNLILPTITFSTDDSNTKIFDPINTPQASHLPLKLQIKLWGSQGPLFLAKKTINLAPHQSIELHYQYHLSETIPSKPPTMLVQPKVQKPLLQPVNCPLSQSECIALKREYTWKTQQLASWGLYRKYYNAVSVPQGSIYAYKMGSDTAPRDIEQTIPILAKTDHQLAQNTLSLMMSLQEVNPVDNEGPGNASYGFWGYGCAGDRHTGLCHAMNGQHFGVRSDLDLYFLWSFYTFYQNSDLNSFTRWLTTAQVPYYPKNETINAYGLSGKSPLDHIKVAFYHLRDSVGVGQHGLVKLKDGDWNDDILSLSNFEGHTIDAKASAQNGESVVASEMVVNVLPNVISMLKTCKLALQLQQDMESYTQKIAAALKKVTIHDNAKGITYFPRAFLIDNNGQSVEMGKDYVDLMAQVWMLTNHNAINYQIIDKNEAISLIKYMHTHLDQSSFGATFWDPKAQLPVPASEIYATTNQESWSSIRQLLTIAYAQYPQTKVYAWDELLHTSFYWHTQYFPTSWMGTLSGPDGWDVKTGKAWNYKIIDQNVFPYANSNPNAMWGYAYSVLTAIKA